MPALLVLTLMVSSLSGCLGLVQGREFLEAQREAAEPSFDYKKYEISHTFETGYSYVPFTEQAHFKVDDQVTEISIYFKASISFSDLIPEWVFGEEYVRYVRATLTDSEGVVQWEQEVSADAAPIEVHLEPSPEFAYGDWTLDVESRGFGEQTTGMAKDNFNVQVTVTRACLQYPLEESCFQTKDCSQAYLLEQC